MKFSCRYFIDKSAGGMTKLFDQDDRSVVLEWNYRRGAWMADYLQIDCHTVRERHGVDIQCDNFSTINMLRPHGLRSNRSVFGFFIKWRLHDHGLENFPANVNRDSGSRLCIAGRNIAQSDPFCSSGDRLPLVTSPMGCDELGSRIVNPCRGMDFSTNSNATNRRTGPC